MSASVVTCTSCGTRNRVPSIAKGRPRCQSCKSALPWITSADDTNFDEVADSSRWPVLVDLWAPWCGPCRQLSPLLEKLTRDRAGKMKLVKVNVDNAPGLAQRFDARSIPALVMLKDGKPVGRQIGALPAAPLTKWVDGQLR